MIKIDLEGKKYTYIFDNGSSEVLRYGEKWRDTTGDGFILAMAQRIEELEEIIREAEPLVAYRSAYKKLANMVPSDFVIDWDDAEQEKWWPYHYKDEWVSKFSYTHRHSQLPYFPTRESLEAAIEAMGDDMDALKFGGMYVMNKDKLLDLAEVCESGDATVRYFREFLEHYVPFSYQIWVAAYGDLTTSTNAVKLLETELLPKGYDQKIIIRHNAVVHIDGGQKYPEWSVTATAPNEPLARLAALCRALAENIGDENE